MKKKIGIAAMAATLAATLVTGTLITPVHASQREFKSCEYCHTVLFAENVEAHEKNCKDNPENIYGTCQYCGLEISTIMDTYMYGQLSRHETRCDKNPNRTYKAVSSAKEEIEIEIELPEIETFKCDKCGKEFNTEDELKAHKESAKEEIEIEIPLPDETFKCDRCGKEFNTKEELEAHKSSAKEEIEIEIPLPDETFKCDRCGKEFNTEEELKEHKAHAKEEIEIEIPLPDETKTPNPSAKEEIEIEIEIPTNDNAEQIAILEAEVIEAERIASEARAEADRLTTIAVEKRAELEALRQ